MQGPERLACRLIAWLLPAEDAGLVEELDELYRERVHESGAGAAGRWYVRQAAGFMVRLAGVAVRDTLFHALAAVEVRTSLRSLGRRPAWSAGFVATLAIGAGGMASVYSVANWVLLRPVPGIADGGSLVTLRLGSTEAPAHVSWPVSHTDYGVLEAQVGAVRALAGARRIDVHVTGADGRPRRVRAEVVTSNYFDVLGAEPVAGRTFGDDERDAVIVSNGLARELAGAVHNAPGRSLRVNGRALLVTGVAAAGFRGAELPGDVELWVPMGVLPVLDGRVPKDLAGRGGYGLWDLMYGRLAGGATEAQVQVEANAAMARVQAAGGSTAFTTLHFQMQAWAGAGANPAVRASVRATLRLLGSAALFLLVLAVANIANLAAMEAWSRRGDVSIRFALGARRRSLAVQWAVEAALLSAAGAAGALGVAVLLNRAFRQMRLDAYGAVLTDLSIDPRVAVFTVALALVAGVLAAVPIVLSASRGGATAGLGRVRTDARAGHGMRNGLVLLQVALSVVLVVSAGLLGRTIVNQRGVDLGFTLDRLVTYAVDPASAGVDGERATALLERIARRLEADPAVRAAGFVTIAPLGGSWMTAAVHRDGSEPEAGRIIAARYRATSGFVRALAARTLAGDAAATVEAGDVVITKTLASRAFPEAAPAAVLGAILRLADQESPLRIGAVIEDVQLDGVPGEPQPTLILPLNAASIDWGAVTGWVRSAGPGPDVAAAVRTAVAAEAPDLPVFDMETGRRRADALNAESHVMARLAAVLAGLGLLLAGVGIYGALGCAVSARLREIGVRVALGATPRRLLGAVAGRGVLLATLGCLPGVAGAFIAGRMLRSRLFGVAPADPAAFAAGIAAVILLALVASLVPAMRAMRVSPVDVMRMEDRA